LSALVAFPGIAAAETTTSTVPPSTPTTTTAPDQPTGSTGATGSNGSNGSGDSSSGENGNLRLTAVAFIAFALLVIGAVLLYLNSAQKRFYETIRAAIRRLGTIPPAESIPSFQAGVAAAASTSTLKIVGPSVLKVGEATTFTALVDGVEASATWAVEPSDGISDPGAEASSVALTASKAGTFKITATATGADGQPVSDSVQVTALQVPDKLPALPLIGAGYGTVTIAIVAITAVVVLGMLDFLDGQALATFFGGIIGYIFLKAGQGGVAQGPAGAPGGDAPPAPPPTP
jgi:hypothetical protein